MERSAEHDHQAMEAVRRLGLCVELVITGCEDARWLVVHESSGERAYSSDPAAAIMEVAGRLEARETAA